MRKPWRHGRLFVVGRRVVGKSWRAAEQTASDKGAPKTALVLEAAKAVSETEVVRETKGEGWENAVG